MSPDAIVTALRRDGASFAGLLGLLAAMALVFAFLLPQRFPTLGTVQSMAFQMPELGILALAMAVPLISGGLNLAIIATANLSALVMAFTIKALLGAEPTTLWTVVALATTVGAGMLVCLAIGLLNGFVTAYVGVHPILVTLGTKTLVDGVAIWWTRGRVISGFPPEIIWLGNATPLSIPVPMLIFGLCAVLVGIVMTRTPWGQRVYMIGSNERATRFSGVDTRRALLGVYVLSSCLCCVAALLMMARFNSARVGYAESYLLVTILAAVLGGIDPFGGFGRIMGLVLGLCVLQVIATGFNLLGFNPQLTLAIWGATLIAVLALGSLQRRRAAGGP
jgi:ribose/xylose/arabinose/galactoside ABC-type transport system permease subunit